MARTHADVWVPPIRNRIDMLATGIKSPIGEGVGLARAAARLNGTAPSA